MAKKNNSEEGAQNPKVSSEKLKALQLTLDKLEKTYGKGTIMKLGDTKIEPCNIISINS